MKKNNKIKKILFFIIICMFIIFNEKIMPSRKELTELELIKVIGMDRINEGKYKMEQTILRVPTQEKNTTSSMGSKENQEGKQTKIFSTKGVTFSDAIRSFQTYFNKTMTGAHIKVILLGEELVKDNITSYMDFNFRDYELRFNSSIYIVKNSTAKEFISKASSDEYSIDEKILSMEKNNEAKTISSKFTIIDFIAMLISDKPSGLVPTLEIIYQKGEKDTTEDENGNDDIQAFQTPSTTVGDGIQTIFDFGGYAIIKDKTLLDYLSREDSITCNIMKNEFKGTNLNIDLGDNNIVSFAIINSETKYDFEFNENKITQITLKNKVKVNYEEIRTEEYILNYEKTNELEEKIGEQIKKEIEKIISKMKETNCDFINISEIFKVKHPYKYQNIKENWEENLLSADFKIETEAKISRTYDILQLE